MIIERLTPPSEQPFSLEWLQLHARVADFEVEELPRFAAAAVADFEGQASLALLTQTIRVTWPEWPGFFGKPVALPIAPVIDPDTVVLTCCGKPVTGFDVIEGLRSAIYLRRSLPAGRAVVTYEAGFGAEAEALPADIVAAILDQAMTYFDARGPRYGGELGNRMSPHMARVAARYRRVAF